jgi:hypothetical protein
MGASMRRISMVAASLALTFLWSVDGAAQVVPADARAFMGDWDVTVEAETPFTFRMNIVDEGGQVVAAVSGPDGMAATVREVARAGEDLVLRYTADLQGQQIPISIRLRPDGESLRGNLTVADGLFAAPVKAGKR